MKTCIRRALQIAGISGGMLFLGGGIASADTGIGGPLDSAIDLSTGSDNSAALVNVPVDISNDQGRCAQPQWPG